MKRTVLTASLVVLGSALSQASVHPSHTLAYTDPGSGAMLWQILVSSGVLVGFYFSRLRNWMFGVRPTSSTETTDHESNNPPSK